MIETSKNQQLADQLTERKRTRFVLVLFSLIVIISGAVQEFARQNVVHTDSVSYIEIAEAILRGDWAMVANSYWNPLYPVLIALFSSMLSFCNMQPTALFEYQSLHLLDFIIYLVCYGSFLYLVRAVIDFCNAQGNCKEGKRYFPAWGFYAVGISLFLQGSLLQIEMSLLPDLLLSIFVYLATAFLIRMTLTPQSFLGFSFFGVILGLGYLTKAIFFPLGFIFLFCAGAIQFRNHYDESRRKTLMPLVLSAIFFLVLCSPVLIGNYAKTSRLTYNDSGKMNYKWLVTRLGVRNFRYHNGKAIHQTPPVFLFTGLDAKTVSCPVWYDPPRYFMVEGEEKTTVEKQLFVIERNLSNWFSDFITLYNGFLILLLLVVCYPGSRSRDYWINLLLCCLPLLAAHGAYSLILLHGRYIGHFMLTLLFLTFTLIASDNTRISAQVLRKALLCFLIIAMLKHVSHFSQQVTLAASHFSQQDEAAWLVASEEQRVVKAIKEFGVRPGAQFCVIDHTVNSSAGSHMFWAHLLDVQISAHIEVLEKDFWNLPDEKRKETYRAIQENDITGIITMDAPPESIFKDRTLEADRRLDEVCPYFTASFVTEMKSILQQIRNRNSHDIEGMMAVC